MENTAIELLHEHTEEEIVELIVELYFMLSTPDKVEVKKQLG